MSVRFNVIIYHLVEAAWHSKGVTDDLNFFYRQYLEAVFLFLIKKKKMQKFT